MAASLAVALFAAGCDSNAGNNETVAAEAPVVVEEPVAAAPIENPNVVPANEVVADENAPVMTFAETEYDFGTVKQGETVKHTFEFTNTGASPLIIENASATCGCTVPEWPREPIAPGEKGQIGVVFNTTGKVGQQLPTVTVRANTQPNIVKVSMKGNVATSSIPTAGADGPVRRN
ncbi:uncharacterized protein DUF1573 [Pontibacter ummariensis]|uniref:DUF1573 domain-containing protein n=2 Tax=Pontibacter ummariensis TaxID=1610492 RepID=A0A239GTN7_9BACT|nr:uncharacterized protein DUF1573 [Pontibacter ummariensis]SNS72586.1 Protein of unknown function [Pontibacter ummariensis]